MNPIMSLLTGRNVAWSSLMMAGLTFPLSGCEPMNQPSAVPAPGSGAPPQAPSEPMVPPAIPERPAPGDSGETKPLPDATPETPPAASETPPPS